MVCHFEGKKVLKKKKKLSFLYLLKVTCLPNVMQLKLCTHVVCCL